MGLLSNYKPGQQLSSQDWQGLSSYFNNPSNMANMRANGSPEYTDPDTGYNFTPNFNKYDQWDGGTIYKIQGKGTYDTPGDVYNGSGQLTTPGFNIHHDKPDFMDNYGFMIPLLAPFAAGALGVGAAGGAAGGAVSSPVLGATGALTGTALGPAAGGATAAAGGLSGLSSILTQLGGKAAMSVLPSLFGNGGGGSGAGNGGGTFGLGDIFNVGAGIYGSQKQGEAANKFMDWMNQNQNYVRNYGTEGTPEFDYLKRTLEAKDAAAGRNSQYGPRTADMLGQLGQAKLDATSRMALGFANPYQKALNQDANKYAGLPAAINKLLGGGGTMNLSSILNGLGNSTGMSTNDFLDRVGADGGLPAGVDYNPSQMPTEDDILPFLDNIDFGQYF